MKDIETKIEIVEITDRFSLHFMHIPDGYQISNLSITEHKCQLIGRLNQFNRLKAIKGWKQDHKDLVHFFKDILSNRGWDFDKFPNPVAFGSYYLTGANP